jgi:hypothetical protein
MTMTAPHETTLLHQWSNEEKKKQHCCTNGRMKRRKNNTVMDKKRKLKKTTNIVVLFSKCFPQKLEIFTTSLTCFPLHYTFFLPNI